MKNYGFFRIAAAVPQVHLADPEANADEICRLVEEAEAGGASIVLFPELSVTGYSCGDLFHQQLLTSSAEHAVARIMTMTRGRAVTVVVGAPVPYCGKLYDCAVVLQNGNIKGIVPKSVLSTQRNEHRQFSSGRDFLSPMSSLSGRFLQNGKDTVREGFAAEISYAGFRCNISPNLIFGKGDLSFGIELSDDMMSPIAPSAYLSLNGAQLILNLAAREERPNALQELRTTVQALSTRNAAVYAYCSAGCGESTQDMVFPGNVLICEDGAVIAEDNGFHTGSSLTFADIDLELIGHRRQQSGAFSAASPDGTSCTMYRPLYSWTGTGKAADTDFSAQLYRPVERHPFTPETTPEGKASRCSTTMDIQVAGLSARLGHIGCRSAVVGISGGLDSTLALLVTVLAADRLGWERKNVISVTMPGYGTTDRTYNNALDLMKALGTTVREIPIAGACDRHFQDIGHDKSVHDVTYENSQARERTQILMDVANQAGGIVIGTGDLSELALGWATYNGDHMSMYGVNASIPKTLVGETVRWAAEHRFTESSGKRSVKEILLDILDTPISPELLPADGQGNIKQKTEDLVGPYELHDFFLYNLVHNGYAPEKIGFLATAAFARDGIYSRETIQKWLKTFMRRFFNQQFKRSCMPDGPQAGDISLAPRGAWAMPSDARNGLFVGNVPEDL